MMTQQENSGAVGHVGETTEKTHASEDAALRAEIASAFEEFKRIEGVVKGLNQEKAAIVEDLQARGINRHALRAVFRFWKMDPESREGLDLSMAICRRAIGEPIQLDILAAPAEITH